MAIATTDLAAVNLISGATLIHGQLNMLVPDAQTSSGVDYGWVQLYNNHATLTLSAARAWIVVDLAGAVLNMAVADASTQRPAGYVYPPQAYPTFPPTPPVDFASGLVLPTLAPMTKCLVTVRRDTAGAGTAYPEVNRIAIQGTSPI